MSDLRFLIVEDDLFYQTYVNDLLSETGVDIVNASDGEAGLALALSEKPNLIITDIEIPKIQGFVLLKNLRENPDTKDIPVIMMSGKVEKDLLERHSRLSTHADGYLMKPFSGQDLIDLIRRVIDVDFKVPDEPTEISVASQAKEPGAAQSTEPFNHGTGSPEENGAQQAPAQQPFPGADAVADGVAASVPAGSVGPRVLIIDDSQYILDISRDFLVEIGAEITTASDGEEGFQLATRNVPDIVLLDVQMPGLNGFVVCEKLKKEAATANVPVILMSAVVDDESFERHAKLRYHADAYLQKPFMKSELQELVAGFTSSRTAPPGSVESKTGFLVPSEEDEQKTLHGEKDTVASRKLMKELKNVKEALVIARENESKAAERIEEVRKERDGFEEKLYELKKGVDGREKELNDKLTLTSHRYEGSLKEIDQLTTEMNELRRQLSATVDSSADAERISSLESQLAESGKEVSRLGQEVGKLTVQLEAKSADAEVAQELAAAQSQLLELKNNLDLSLSENETLRAQLSGTVEVVDLEKQVTEMTASLEAANARVEELTARNDELQKEIGLKDVDEESAKKLEEALEKVATVQQAHDNLERDLLAAVAAKNEIEDQVKTLIEDSRSEETGSTEIQELELLRTENKELAVRVSEAESKTKWLAEVEKQLDTVQGEADRLREELERAPVEDAPAELHELEDLQEKLEAALKQSEELSVELENTRAKLTDTATELESALESADEAKEDFLGRIKILEADLSEARSVTAQAGSESEDADDRMDQVLKEKEHLEADLEEARKLLDKADDYEGRISVLEEELDSERAKRAELEQEAGRLRKADTAAGLAADDESERLAELEADIEEARRLLDKADENEDRLEELAAELEAEKALRSAIEEEVENLRSLEAGSKEDTEKIAELEAARKELAENLEDMREERDQMAAKVSMLKVEARKAEKAGSEGEGQVTRTEERLEELEQLLSDTVNEAQAALKEQKDRESTLEESVESLKRSLEEERAISQRDRSQWIQREDELKDAFEDALRESRRLMGEEAARLYPMHIPRQARPLEVVTGMRKYGIAAGLAVTAVVIFLAGHFILSGPGRDPGSAAVPPTTQGVQGPAKTSPPTGQVKPPMPFIATTGASDNYETLWRRNTVQSVSEDMMLQATFHTKQELEAAITYTASKEGWTTERVAKAMGDLARTYDLEESYYVTVFSKNLKGGYPGYADNFERHIALRDGSGTEVRASLPEILERSKFITSRVSAAGKDMNPVFLYEVGLTVAFPKEKFGSSPGGLQLVLYDVGAVPMRVLTWDMGTVGSFYRGNGTAPERRST